MTASGNFAPKKTGSKAMTNGTVSASPPISLGGAKRIPRWFFVHDPRVVAAGLLGKLLVRFEGKKLLLGRIVETEAYLGIDDPAAHSAAGKTARNSVLFGPPGHVYVYFIYGNHYCLNVSCMPDGEAGGVLIRALEPIAGLAEMAKLRDLHQDTYNTRLLTSGPGRLAQAFAITRARDNGKDFLDPKSDLQLLDDGFRPERILTTPRIGITKAAKHELRYLIAGNEFISGGKKA